MISNDTKGIRIVPSGLLSLFHYLSARTSIYFPGILGTLKMKMLGDRRPLLLRGSLVVLCAVFLMCLSASARAETYKQVSIDENGQLHIMSNTGKEILPRKLPEQVSFDSAAISPDHKTIGWLVEYPWPRISISDYDPGPIAGGLVLYQAGRRIHTFSTVQVFWNWHFLNGGRRIAYSTGPTHGGAAECLLRDVQSGRVLARWFVTPNANPPRWAETLRR